MVILELSNLTKSFGGVEALSELSCRVEKGQIKGLIGPNGAGKTTLFNVITGIYRPDSGKVMFNGQTLNRLKPHEIADIGIARTFQNIKLFVTMSVLENVMVGRHSKTKSEILNVLVRPSSVKMEERSISEKARELLEFTGLAGKASMPAGDLSFVEQRRLQLAQCLALEPELLLLDEPASGLNAREIEDLIQLIYRIREQGITIFLVDHRMGLVMSICDEMVVLNFGKKIMEGSSSQVQEHPEVISAYLGAGR